MILGLIAFAVTLLVLGGAIVGAVVTTRERPVEPRPANDRKEHP